MIKSFFKNLFFVKESIQAKVFTAFVMVTLCSLMIVASVIYTNAANTIKNNAAEYVIGSMRNSNNNLEMLLKEADDIMRAVLGNCDLMRNVFFSFNYPISYEWFQELKNTENFLTSLISSKTYITRLVLVTTDGKIYKAGAQWIDPSTMRQPWAEKVAEAKGSRVVMKRNVADTDDGNVITMARAVMQGKKVVGMIYVDMDFNILHEVFDLNTSKGNFILILDRDGSVVYSSNHDIKAENIKDTLFSSVYDVNSEFNQQKEFRINSTKYLAVYYRSDYSGWITIGVIPEANLFKESDILRKQVVAIVILVLLIILNVSMMVSGQITRGIKRLCNIMRNVDEDNLNIALPISSKDEIGQLEKRFVAMMSRIRKLMADIKSEEEQKRIMELKALQAQINPHFLYNVLNTIGYLAQIQNVPNIEEITSSVINLLRVISLGNDELITVKDELQYIDSYVKIQKYRNLNGFSVVYQVEEDALRCKTPKLILQPIVENAIVHGIETLAYEGVISIKIYKDAETLKMIVTDNGVGMTAEQIETALNSNANKEKLRFSGIGIGNVNERIKLLFGDKYGLSIYSQPEMYTRVEISIPVIYEEGDDVGVEGAVSR